MPEESNSNRFSSILRSLAAFYKRTFLGYILAAFGLLVITVFCDFTFELYTPDIHLRIGNPNTSPELSTIIAVCATLGFLFSAALVYLYQKHRNCLALIKVLQDREPQRRQGR
jgi:hypothetical protein